MPDSGVPKILLVDKPKGITSFDVIRRLRKEFGIRKMGHAGTLDPLASGLMLIGVNEGTKELAQHLKLPKTYDAHVLFGERRATGDMEGAVLEERSAADLREADVEVALRTMVGKLELLVPVYSAMKQSGVPLYAKARKGKEVEVPMRTMEVRGATLQEFEVVGERAVARITFDVASGVYIRSLAEELGRRVGYPATIKDLRRTKIGDFDIADARSI